MPSLDFIDKVTNREEKRETKNVNRKLQKLKEQIRLEKEKKREKRKKPGASTDEVGAKEDEEELLVVKARHSHIESSDDIPEYDSSTPQGAGSVRHPKRIRIDSNKSTKFEEDGTEKGKLFQAKSPCDDRTDDDAFAGVQEANNSYVHLIRQRLERTKELDKREERERIRAKHKKKRYQEKDQHAEGQAGIPASTLIQEHSSGNTIVGEKTDSPSNPDSSSYSSSSDGEDEDESFDLSVEDRALALIRGSSANIN